MHPLEEKIRTTKNKVAVIPFLTAGFPNKEDFWKHLEDLDRAGADIIEIGVPFSDPVADGPVVEEASRRVLQKGISLAEILAGLKERKFTAGLVLMGYINPFLAYGFDKLARDAKAAGVGGLIVPDLPFEEARPLNSALKKENIALVPLVGLNTNEDRMRLYAQEAQGYVYLVSVMGITGARKKIAEGVADKIGEARKIFKVPVALGFGLKHPDQLLELPEIKDRMPRFLVAPCLHILTRARLQKNLCAHGWKMCGRFDLDSREAEVKKLLQKLPPTSPQVKVGEIFPTNMALTLVAKDGQMLPAAMSWGFPRRDGKCVIFNARAETSLSKPMFKQALLKNPAVIPTTGFFEWTKNREPKIKYIFRPKDGGLLYLAGFWNRFPDQPWPDCFTILTTAANESLLPVHERMPVLLTEAERIGWLTGENMSEILQRKPFPIEAERAD